MFNDHQYQHLHISVLWFIFFIISHRPLHWHGRTHKPKKFLKSHLWHSVPSWQWMQVLPLIFVHIGTGKSPTSPPPLPHRVPPSLICPLISCNCSLLAPIAHSAVQKRHPSLTESESTPVCLRIKFNQDIFWPLSPKWNLWSPLKKSSNCLNLCRSVRDVGQREREEWVRPPCVAKLT